MTVNQRVGLFLLLLALIGGVIILNYTGYGDAAFILGVIFGLPGIFIIGHLFNSEGGGEAISGLQNLVKRYQLKNVHTGFGASKKIMEGTIDGHEIKVEVKRLSPIEQIVIKVKCENPAGKTLFLSRENATTKLGKRLGLPDILIGNSTFDNKYLIQSDDANFARQIFDKRLQGIFLKAQFVPMGTLALGDKKKKEILKLFSQKKDAKDVLDYELLFEKGKAFELNSGTKEETNYIRYAVKTGRFKSKVSILHLEHMIPCIIELAKKIDGLPED